MYIVPTLFSRLLYICIQAFIYFYNLIILREKNKGYESNSFWNILIEIKIDSRGYKLYNDMSENMSYLLMKLGCRFSDLKSFLFR